MSAHSKTNGDQTRALLKEVRALRRAVGAGLVPVRGRPQGSPLQSRIDSAVALADQRISVGAGLVPARPGGPARGQPQGLPLQGVTAPFGLPYGPLSPAPEPAPPPGPPVWMEQATSVFSVPGTPIISGFLTDVGEYNPELQGRNAVLVYEKMRRGDGQVEATLQALMLPVLSANWDVRPGVDKSDPQYSGAKEIARFVRENLFGGLEFRSSTGGWVTQSWEEVVRNALLMLPFGVAVHEDVYAVDGGMIRLRMLADLLPITFYRWHVDEDGRTLLYLGQYGYRGARFEQVSVPADKITVFTFRREAANFWGRSVLRPAYPHWYIKNQLYRIDAISAERNSLGVPVIILPPGFSKEDHDAAVNFVTQLAAHERTGIVLPSGSTFDILGVKGTLKDLNPSIQHHNEQISIQALAMFMNLGRTESGSRSLGREQSKFFMLSLQNVANKIAEQITNTTIRRMVYYNFGTNSPCPKLVAANVQSRALEDIVDALTRFAQAGLVVSDFDLRAFIRKELALPEESRESVVVPPSRGAGRTPVKGQAVGEGGKGGPARPESAGGP